MLCLIRKQPIFENNLRKSQNLLKKQKKKTYEKLYKTAKKVFKKYDNEKSGKFDICVLHEIVEKIDLPISTRQINEIKD